MSFLNRILIPGDDIAEVTALRDAVFADLGPKSPIEEFILEQLATDIFRKRRFAILQSKLIQLQSTVVVRMLIDGYHGDEAVGNDGRNAFGYGPQCIRVERLSKLEDRTGKIMLNTLKFFNEYRSACKRKEN